MDAKIARRRAECPIQMTLQRPIDRQPKSTDVSERDTRSLTDLFCDAGPASPHESPQHDWICWSGLWFRRRSGYSVFADQAGEPLYYELLPLSEIVVRRKRVVSRRSAEETYNRTLSVCIEL